MSVSKLTASEKRQRQQDARDWLAAHLDDGDTIYTKVRYTRGHTRYGEAYIVLNGRIERITHWIARAAGRTLNKDLEIQFCGGGYSVPTDMMLMVCYALRGTDAGQWLKAETL